MILNINSPLLPSCWGFSFVPGHGISLHSHSRAYHLTGVSLTLDMGYLLMATPGCAATTHCSRAMKASLSITNSWSLLKLMSIESVMPSNHLILCHPLFLLPSIFPSIRVFLNESVLHIRWPKYWSFSFSISPSNEYSGRFSLEWTGWISLQSKVPSMISNTTVQKHQFFGCSAFFIVQLSHPYMTTGKTIVLII